MFDKLANIALMQIIYRKDYLHVEYLTQQLEILHHEPRLLIKFITLDDFIV